MISYNDAIKIINKMPIYLIPVGSIARKSEKVDDIDFITSKPSDKIINDLTNKFPQIKIIKHGKLYLKFNLYGIDIDIWRYNNLTEKLFMKFARTNTKEKNLFYRSQAKKKNMLLNDRGLYSKNGIRINIKSISQLKEILKK